MYNTNTHVKYDTAINIATCSVILDYYNLTVL